MRNSLSRGQPECYRKPAQPASVAELADASGLGPGVRKDVGVRVPPLAPAFQVIYQ